MRSDGRYEAKGWIDGKRRSFYSIQQMAKAMERYWSLIEEAGETRMRFAK